MKNPRLLSVIFVALLSSASNAQILVEEGQGQSTLPSTSYESRQESQPEATRRKNVGEGAARQYFIERKERATSMGASRQPSSIGGGGPRYLAVQAGTFISDKQYRWGKKERNEDVGEMILNLSYRMGQWKNSMDLLLRAEFMTYDIDSETPRKLSLMPVVTFPDVEGNFPLYFGAGVGVGVFLDQVASESDLSLDYQVIAGVRFLDLWENGGLVAETGIKGHVHLVSSGQFNGVFLTVGGAWNF